MQIFHICFCIIIMCIFGCKWEADHLLVAPVRSGVQICMPEIFNESGNIVRFENICEYVYVNVLFSLPTDTNSENIWSYQKMVLPIVISSHVLIVHALKFSHFRSKIGVKKVQNKTFRYHICVRVSRYDHRSVTVVKRESFAICILSAKNFCSINSWRKYHRAAVM